MVSFPTVLSTNLSLQEMSDEKSVTLDMIRARPDDRIARIVRIGHEENVENGSVQFNDGFEKR